MAGTPKKKVVSKKTSVQAVSDTRFRVIDDPIGVIDSEHPGTIVRFGRKDSAVTAVELLSSGQLSPDLYAWEEIPRRKQRQVPAAPVVDPLDGWMSRGKAFEALGKAMQDHNSDLRTVIGLAFDAGLRLSLFIGK